MVQKAKETLRAYAPYLIALLSGGAGTIATQQATKPESVGGHLNYFINNDYRSFKEWVSSEIKESNKRVEKNTEYRLRQEGAASVNVTHSSNQFVNEYHNGVMFARNMITNKLFYEIGGHRYRTYYSQEKNKYYYLGADNISRWCE